MPPEVATKRFTADERAFFIARLLVTLLLAGLYVYFIPSPQQSARHLYLIALAILTVDGIGLLVAIGVAHAPAVNSLLAALVPDLVAIAMFTYLFDRVDDGFFPVCVLMAVMFALVASRRQSYAASAAITLAYALGHIVEPYAPLELVIFALKAFGILLVGMIVANSVGTRRNREADFEEAVLERERLNEQLSRRVAELQAVSEITEIIHSSLDFDRVGPVVLDIVSKAIGIDSCCLFVIDKTKSETLFSASVGSIAPISNSGYLSGGTVLESVDDHFTCTPVYDHVNMMVLFCATNEDTQRLTDEDRLVVNAVASELVVAVENSRLYKLTKRLAITDELTGLSNYRHLQQRLDEEVGRARRYDKHVSLLMIDADDFKGFNDTHGHIAGDGALADLADVLRISVREVDVVARYGGEEFSVILPETDAAGAFIVAEKIRESVAQHSFADAEGQRNCTVTVSIGVATYPTHAWDKESLLREADDAVYNAKHGGKNRVRTPARPAPQDEPEVSQPDVETTGA